MTLTTSWAFGMAKNSNDDILFKPNQWTDIGVALSWAARSCFFLSSEARMFSKEDCSNAFFAKTLGFFFPLCDPLTLITKMRIVVMQSLKLQIYVDSVLCIGISLVLKA